MNKHFIKWYLLFILSALTSVCDAQNKSEHPNILFIGIDDLRPELACYGSEIAVSPNLDKLAGKGLMFERAYCQQAICGPSRASLMTGIRPSSRGVTHNYIKFRERISEPTIAQHFGDHGYSTVFMGKIFHHGDDDAISWNTEPVVDSLHLALRKSMKGFVLPENLKVHAQFKKEMFAKYGKVAKYGLAMGPAYECADVPDNAYIDGYNTDIAIATLEQLAQNKEQPFFLALGFNKPHLNWTSPKKYWDLYNRNAIELTRDSLPPLHGSAMGLHPSFELRTRYGIPKSGQLSDSLSITLKHAYLACVSYVDAQIGRVIEALEKTGVADNTIIIVWSDHGWHLGDKGIWGKATNYEIATRVPLIIYAPQQQKNTQQHTTKALVELVDMYPTLCDLANLPQPKHLEGLSFKPLLTNPNQHWKKAAFSQFPTPALREWGAYPLRPAMRETYFGQLIQQMEKNIAQEQGSTWNRKRFENNVMGHAIRTDRYRLIVWKDETQPQTPPLAIELYDHHTDPTEQYNIAANQPELVQELLQELK